jgi:LysR family glycine cleavage system transcriptional activator
MLGRMDCDDVDGVTSPRWPEWMAAAGIDDFDDDRCVAAPNPRDVVQAVTDGAEVALAEPEMPACEFAADSTPCSTSV